MNINVNLKKWMNELDEAVKVLIGKKFKNATDLHHQILEIIRPLVKEEELSVGIWDIYNKDYESILKYEIESEDDKRVKNGRKGKYINITFVPSIDIDNTDITMEQYLHQIDIEKKSERVSEVENLLQDAKKTVERLEKLLNNTKAELIELKHKYD